MPDQSTVMPGLDPGICRRIGERGQIGELGGASDPRVKPEDDDKSKPEDDDKWRTVPKLVGLAIVTPPCHLTASAVYSDSNAVSGA